MENKNEWKKVKLGDIGEIVSGGTPKTSVKEYWNGNISWLTPKDFSNKNYKYWNKGERNITKEGLKNSSAKLLPKGTVLFTSRAPIGYVGISDTNLCTNQGFKNIIVNEENSNEFIYYLLKFITPQIINIAGGSTFKEISATALRDFEVYIPKSKKYQKKIAKILSDIDAKIELNNKINNNLEILIFLIYQKIFLNNNFSQRKLCKMEEYFNISIGKTPPRKNKECFSNNSNDNIWVSILDMKSSGIYIDKSSEYLTSEAIKKYNVKVIPKNTLLLSFKLTIGRIAITCQDRTTTNEAIAHFLTDKKGATEYLYCYLKNFNFNILGSTSSIATAINSKIIKEITFIIPEEDELNEFYNLVNPLFKKIRTFQLENIKLTNLKNYLLPKLMNGEIDVENIEL